MENSLKPENMPPAMILCGGKGTRLRDVSELLPKPMVPVGPHPIIWHIMKTYASFGVKRFILCLGYKRETFINYFLNYQARATDVTIKLGDKGNVIYHGGHGEEDWEVVLADTGDETMTGGRVSRAAKYLRGDEDKFFLTYGDGLANVNMDALLKCHEEGDRLLTVSAVHPPSRFGEMVLNGNKVESFEEKPLVDVGLINGGYMVVQKKFVAKYLTDNASLTFEQEPLRAALNDEEMSAYVHKGFWQCMDTAREYEILNGLWDTKKAPWTEAW
jgi:glucose-1-phosphate cytidylyltransferase